MVEHTDSEKNFLSNIKKISSYAIGVFNDINDGAYYSYEGISTGLCGDLTFNYTKKTWRYEKDEEDKIVYNENIDKISIPVSIKILDMDEYDATDYLRSMYLYYYINHTLLNFKWHTGCNYIISCLDKLIKKKYLEKEDLTKLFS